MSSPSAKVALEASTDEHWWRGAVIYQIYPRSFQDSNGDGIGDLPGITRRLDYIADLGVDAIWLSPFFTSPMKDMGYDVSDYCDVDPIFGTLDDFRDLVARAHGLGLKVIIDQVLSHTSDAHPWFDESRRSRDNAKSDWYVWADPKPDGTPTEQLAVHLRRTGVVLGSAATAILLSQFPVRPTGSEFPQSGGPGCPARRGAFLARAWCRWFPAGHRELLLSRRRIAQQPADAGWQIKRHTGYQSIRISGPHLRQDPAREPRGFCVASGRCSTSIREPHPSAKSETAHAPCARWLNTPRAMIFCTCATRSTCLVQTSPRRISKNA